LPIAGAAWPLAKASLPIAVASFCHRKVPFVTPKSNEAVDSALQSTLPSLHSEATLDVEIDACWPVRSPAAALTLTPAGKM
jgi:hypothetical protein